MGHGANLSVRILHHQDISRSQCSQEGRAVALHLEQDEVRPDAPRIQGAGRRLCRPAGSHDPLHRAQCLGQSAGVRVVLHQPRDHPVRAIREGHQPGCGEDPGLAHPAADQLAGATGAPDDIARTDEHRADRAGQGLRQAERDGVGRIGQISRPEALRDDRVPEAGSVDVKRDTMGMGDVGHLAGVGRRQWLAHRMRVGVLDGDEAGDRLVRVGRVAKGLLDGGRIDRSVRTVFEGSDAGAYDDRVTGRLVEDHVVFAARDRLLATGQVRQLSDEVAHRSGGHEQAGLLAQQFRSAVLQGVDRRVIPEDVVAELGLSHRPAHGGGWVGDGVTAKIDLGHRGIIGRGRGGARSPRLIGP